jgi:hypothetical protein
MKWWHVNKRDADLERELRSKLELEEAEQRYRGKSPEEAHYAARDPRKRYLPTLASAMLRKTLVMLSAPVSER